MGWFPTPVPLQELISGGLAPMLAALLIMLGAHWLSHNRQRAVGGGALAIGVAMVIGRLGTWSDLPALKFSRFDGVLFLLAVAVTVLGLLGALWQLRPGFARPGEAIFYSIIAGLLAAGAACFVMYRFMSCDFENRWQWSTGIGVSVALLWLVLPAQAVPLWDKLLTSIIGAALAGAAVWILLVTVVPVVNTRIEWACGAALVCGIASFLVAWLAEKGTGFLVPLAMVMMSFTAAIMMGVSMQRGAQWTGMLAAALGGALLVTALGRSAPAARSLVTATFTLLITLMIGVYHIGSTDEKDGPQLLRFMALILASPLLGWVSRLPGLNHRPWLGGLVALLCIAAPLAYAIGWVTPQLLNLLRQA